MAALRSLLVHLDGSARCPARLDWAAAFAARHGARLTALFARGPPAQDAAFPYAAAASAGARLQAAYAERLGRALAAFDAAQAAHGSRLGWAQTHGEPVAAAVAHQAMRADLVVLGAGDPAEGSDFDLPAVVMGASGRPALVLPRAGALHPSGRRVLVAWKEAPESARALAAALPLLARAERVHVVAWGVREGDGPRWAGQPLQLESHLAAHGVAADVHRFRDEPRDVAQALLAAAADFEADLVVMGCYGHSRAREWALGGATRSVLRGAPLPVLMCR